MTDCVAIAPELPFRQQASPPQPSFSLELTRPGLSQVVELAAHLSRSLPNATDQTAVRDFISSFETQLTPEDGEAELDDEKMKAVVRSVVKKFSELRGGLEAAKEIGQSWPH